jgi:hypothetical protein
MLSKDRIQEVILGNIFQLATPEAANKIARELELPPGSVILGNKTISVTEGDQTRHLQITGDGRSIVFVDPSVL